MTRIGGARGNVGNMLNGPLLASLPVGCCGFFSPSFDLANAYRVDADGLPDFDNHQKDFFPSNFDATYAVPTHLSVDPRLDYTIGRQGVPFRDWGLMAGTFLLISNRVTVGPLCHIRILLMLLRLRLTLRLEPLISMI